MRASTSSGKRGICHVVVTLLDSTGINRCTGSVTGLVLLALLGPIPPKSSRPSIPAAASGIAQTISSMAEVTNQQISKQGRRPAGDQTGITGEKPPNSVR